MGLGHGKDSSDHHPWQMEAGDLQGLQLPGGGGAVLEPPEHLARALLLVCSTLPSSLPSCEELWL